MEMNRILIGVTGGSAAGKTTLCNNILKQMAFDSSFKVQIIPLDSFYKSKNSNNIDVDKTKVNVADYNFDHPNALDFDDAYNVLSELLRGKKTKIPKYSFATHSRLSEV
jgi:uridine kinase